MFISVAVTQRSAFRVIGSPFSLSIEIVAELRRAAFRRNVCGAPAKYLRAAAMPAAAAM